MKTTIFESLIVLMALLYCGTAKAQHVMRVVLTADGTPPNFHHGSTHMRL